MYKVQNVEAKGKAHSTATTARGGGGGATRLHEMGLDMNSGTAEEAAETLPAELVNDGQPLPARHAHWVFYRFLLPVAREHTP